MQFLNVVIVVIFCLFVMEVWCWLEGVIFLFECLLINVSQVVFVQLLFELLCCVMVDVLLQQVDVYLYGLVFGCLMLCDVVVWDWLCDYGGMIWFVQVVIMQGCNQVFCVVMQMLVGLGDQIILLLLWYFNYKMWLDMQGIGVVGLYCGQGMIFDVVEVEKLLIDRICVIVLVSFNNFLGVEYLVEILCVFMMLVCVCGIVLIFDEIYCDFDSCDGVLYDLFIDFDWVDMLIYFYSFFKVYCLIGYCVGVLIVSEVCMVQVEKFLDIVVICVSQIGQIGVEWGMVYLGDWLVGEWVEILVWCVVMQVVMVDLLGWQVKGCGVYFVWVEYLFDMVLDQLVKCFVVDVGVLMLFGMMFMLDGDVQGVWYLCIVFVNVDVQGIVVFVGWFVVFCF